MKPKHLHDCDACVYLGTNYARRNPLGSDYQSGTGNFIDWYWCPPPGGIEGSIIGRYGHAGDYWSTPIKMLLDHERYDSETTKANWFWQVATVFAQMLETRQGERIQWARDLARKVEAGLSANRSDSGTGE